MTKPERNYSSRGGGDAVYGMGLIGAVVYYVQHSQSAGAFIVGLLKALFWPAFVVYHLLGFLKI